MDIKFESLTELYKRMKPALTAKKNEFQRLGIKYIKEEDIWNYLKETKWGKSINLSLSEMVNDVLNSDNYKIESYVQKKMDEIPRTVNLEENNEV
jgi:UTP-glucose-1-phosphate uridylyltransferase